MRTGALAATVGAIVLSGVPGSAVADSNGALTARSFRIATSGGFVTRLGPWRVSDPSLSRAVAVFGTPSSLKPSGGPAGCRVHWRALRISATFSNFGGYSACDPAFGKVSFFTVRSRAWRTIGGLRVGQSTSRMLRMYPDAELVRGKWELVTADFGYGTSDIATVAAVPRNGRVAALTMYVGGAGD